MALDVTLSVDISSDRLTGTLNDDTTYGGSNPSRAALRVFADGYKMTADNTATTLTLTSNTSDPQTVTSWDFDISEDGWFKFYYVAIPAYAGGTTYAIYDAVYDNDNTVYRSKQNGNVGNALSNTTYWEVITDPAALAANLTETNESLNITSLIYQRVLTPNSEYAYSNMIGENCSCSDCDENETIYDYQIFSFWLNGALVADERTEVVKGETICRRIASRFIDC